MPAAHESVSDRALPPWRRQRALVRALRRRIRRRWLVRMGRVTAWYAAVTSGGLAVWMGAAQSGVDGSSLLAQSMGWLTVAAALVALGTAVDLSRVEREDGLDALLRQRGYGHASRQSARFVATVELVAGAILWPAVAVGAVLIGMANSFAEVVARTLRVIAVFAYAPLAGVLLGALARWSVALAPARPRTLLVALLVLPHLVFLATGEGPSAVRILGGMLDRIAELAGGIG